MIARVPSRKVAISKTDFATTHRISTVWIGRRPTNQRPPSNGDRSMGSAKKKTKKLVSNWPFERRWLNDFGDRFVSLQYFCISVSRNVPLRIESRLVTASCRLVQWINNERGLNVVVRVGWLCKRVAAFCFEALLHWGWGRRQRAREALFLLGFVFLIICYFRLLLFVCFVFFCIRLRSTENGADAFFALVVDTTRRLISNPACVLTRINSVKAG